MKRITNLITLCLLVSFGATAQISIPQPSSKGSVGSTVGLTEVMVEYFRPKKRDRKIFGIGDEFLEQYGKVWRTGANSGSVLTLSTDVKIGGEDVKAGSYLIFTVPGEKEWRFMLYSDLSLGGNVAGYDKSKEVLNIGVKPSTPIGSVETLTFQITDISDDNTKANLELSWDNTIIKVPMEVDFDSQVMETIEAQTQVNPQNYLDAANYYMSTNKDLSKALDWMNKYLAIGQNSQQFWNLHTKARILAGLGEKKDAIKTAEQSMELAKTYDRGDFGYIKRNEDLIASLKEKKK